MVKAGSGRISPHQLSTNATMCRNDNRKKNAGYKLQKRIDIVGLQFLACLDEGGAKVGKVGRM